MKKEQNIQLKVGIEAKDAIQKIAAKRGTTVTRLMWRGLIKEVPEIKDVILKDNKWL